MHLVYDQRTGSWVVHNLA